jgi:hypothetical protein
MDFDAINSWLMHANWLFLAIWLVLLAAAVRACFPRPTAANGLSPRSEASTHGD